MKDLQVKLEHLARTDPLTGAHNRRYFIELNEKEIHRAWRSNLPLSIAMIDIDHFKRINDTHGHAIGDLVLKKLVSICWDQIRPYDILGRVGGEEFGITLVDCDIQKASVVMERLRKSVEQHTVVSNGLEVNITISIGVAQLDNESDTWETVMNLADKALYRAKTAGRNRVETALK
jgi:diguanylate cyclase (GGDEF)-like protein